jgi:hypothetical protein
VTTSGGLINIVANALGQNAETVGVHVRNLRLASLLSRRGVGKSAATMNALDAARVLLAAAASVQAKDSVESVMGYGKLLSAEGSRAAARGKDTSAFTLEYALAVELVEVAARWPSPRVVSDSMYVDSRWEPDDSRVGSGPALQLFTTLGNQQAVERAVVLRSFASAAKGAAATTHYFGAGDRKHPAMDEASFCRATGANITQSRTIAAKAFVYITRRL